jgi:predicted transposase YbfD/YdcC
MVSAGARANRLMLGQQQVAGDANEMTAVPALRERLALTGGIVTLDAMHRQTDTVDAMRTQEADYVSTVKGNQETLQREIRAAFAAAHASEFRTLASEQWDVYHVSAEEGHGWREPRSSWTIMNPPVLAACNPEGRRRDLNAIGMVRAERTVGGKTSMEERFFIDGTARTFGEAVRIHWAIENIVHWSLDVVVRTPSPGRRYPPCAAPRPAPGDRADPEAWVAPRTPSVTLSAHRHHRAGGAPRARRD